MLAVSALTVLDAGSQAIARQMAHPPKRATAGADAASKQVKAPESDSAKAGCATQLLPYPTSGGKDVWRQTTVCGPGRTIGD